MTSRPLFCEVDDEHDSLYCPMIPLRPPRTAGLGILFPAFVTLALARGPEEGVLFSERIDFKTRRGPVVALGDRFGESIDTLGDLDGDGFIDLVVGAPYADDGQRSGLPDSGSVWVLFSNGDCSIRESKKISAKRGRLRGPLDAGDRFGTSVAGIGDLDGDGVVDVAVGAPRDGDGRSGSGAVYILFLNADGSVRAEQKISDLRGGFRGIFSGGYKGKGDEFGRALVSLGDLDGDGVTDLAVGAPNHWEGNAYGCVWLLFLHRDGTVKEHAQLLPHPTGITLANEGFYGIALETIGDFDDDGTIDLAIGASHDGSSGTRRAGSVFLTLLTDEGSVRDSIQITDGVRGLRKGTLAENDQFGSGLAYLGDFDGDGVGDLAVGACEDDEGGARDAGSVHLLYLDAEGSVRRQLKIANGLGGLDRNLAAGAEFGSSLAPLGDCNGDGSMDLVVGARREGGRGAIYQLVLGDGSLQAPRARGTGLPRSGPTPLRVGFKDTSQGDYEQVEWNFGDGTRSNERDPVHIYTIPGTYTVELTVSGPAGTSTRRYEDAVKVAPPLAPVAKLSATPSRGIAPLQVRFRDESLGAVTSWTWNFGDGSRSNEEHPTHTYKRPGRYAVSLEVRGPHGSDRSTHRGAIGAQLAVPPTADFHASPTTGEVPFRVAFTDRSIGYIESWKWNFGDGSRSEKQNPVHTYTKAGTYTVTLTTNNSAGDHHRIRRELVKVGPPSAPTAFFVPDSTSGGVALAVDFDDRSTGAITSWLWDFGDGSTSNDREPRHLYTQAGTYHVSLTVRGPGGVNRFDEGLPIRAQRIEHVSFQHGVDGYGATLDTRIEEANPVARYADEDKLRWDLEIEGGQQGTLIRFDEIFGHAPGLVPPGSKIRRATLELVNFERGDEAFLHEVEVPWDATLTWERFGPSPGIQSYDYSPRVGLLYGEVGREEVDVTASLRRFADQPERNQGWLILPTTNDGAAFRSSEYASPSERPKLSIAFVPKLEDPPPPSLPLADGSFEKQFAPGAPGPPWNSSGGAHLVHPHGIPSDGGMPAHGRQWLELSAEGTFDARGPTHPGRTTDPPRNGAGIAQSFRTPKGYTTLRFSAAFLLNGALRDRKRNDWFSVDVSDGATTANLLYLDSFANLPNISQRYERPMSALHAVAVDLAELFPQSDPMTRFTVTATVGNGGDGARPSSAYIDDFRLTASTPRIQRLGCGENPPGSLTVQRGTPRLGTEMIFGIQNPLGSQAPGALTGMILSLQGSAELPCGTKVPYFGMGAGPGALLLDLGAEHLVHVIHGPRWPGPEQRSLIRLPIPSQPEWLGVTIYVQGYMLDPGKGAELRVGLTDALRMTLEE